MAIATDKAIMDVISKIESRLSMIEEYAAWTIRADQRFKAGQRVEFSRRAKEGTIATGRAGKAKFGVVKAVRGGFIVSVLLDGYKHPKDFHHSFFNAVKGPKLF